jgi:hypothetical protein
MWKTLYDIEWNEWIRFDFWLWKNRCESGPANGADLGHFLIVSCTERAGVKWKWKRLRGFGLSQRWTSALVCVCSGCPVPWHGALPRYVIEKMEARLSILLLVAIVGGFCLLRQVGLSFRLGSLLKPRYSLASSLSGLHGIQKSPQLQKRLKRDGRDVISSSMLSSIP